MSKNLEISMLLDYYSGMLTDKQREVAQWYYDEDLSLAEIAEHAGITRQGVRDSIKRAEVQLLECEACLGVKARFDKIQKVLDEINAHAVWLQDEGGRTPSPQALWERAQRIIELTDEISW